MFERFTQSARESVVQAQIEARELDSPAIGTEHVLLGALWNADGIARTVMDEAGLDYRQIRGLIGPADANDDEVLSKLGINMEAVRQRVDAAFGSGALERAGRRSTRRHLPFSRAAKKTLEISLREAINNGHNYIGVEHILLALTRVRESSAAALIGRAGIDVTAVHDQLGRRLRDAA